GRNSRFRASAQWSPGYHRAARDLPQGTTLFTALHNAECNRRVAEGHETLRPRRVVSSVRRSAKPLCGNAELTAHRSLAGNAGGAPWCRQRSSKQLRLGAPSRDAPSFSRDVRERVARRYSTQPGDVRQRDVRAERGEPSAE